MRRLRRRVVVANLKSGTVMRGVWMGAKLSTVVLKDVTMLATLGQTLKPPRPVDGEVVLRLIDIDWVQDAER